MLSVQISFYKLIYFLKNINLFETTTKGKCPKYNLKIQFKAITFRTKTRAGGELGNIDYLDCKLLTRRPVHTSPHHAKRTPVTNKHACEISFR